MNNLLVRTVAAAALGLAFVIACQELLYAGTTTGEGFSASVLAVLTILLQYVVLGNAKARLSFPPILFYRALVVGLALLVALVVGPMLLGGALLESGSVAAGPVTLKSAMLFDIAVFLLVGGSLLTAFTWGVSDPEPPGVDRA